MGIARVGLTGREQALDGRASVIVSGGPEPLGIIAREELGGSEHASWKNRKLSRDSLAGSEHAAWTDRQPPWKARQQHQSCG